MAGINDDLFAKFAEESEKQANKSSSGTFNFNYEDIKWTGCNTNEPRIVRFVGGPPDSNIDETTAKTVNIAWPVGDDGKKFKLIRPSITADPNYIINKILLKVLASRWVNKVKTFPIQEKYPDIYNIVTKNGIPSTDSRYKFDKGWQGKEVIIANVIDREDMEWHRSNKHTKLLAKSITHGQNGEEYVDEGISSYALSPSLSHQFRSYGSWEKYDLAITRTGQMNNPYTVVNATNSPREINPAFQQFISGDDHLTEEEASWKKYDLNKLYKVTSATKILNRLRNTIMRIDVALGTGYLKELEALAEQEKRDRENAEAEKTAAEQSYTSPTAEVNNYEPPAPATIKENTENPFTTTAMEVPTRVTTRPVAEATPAPAEEAWKNLPFGNMLPEETKKLVLDAKAVPEKGENYYEVKWDFPEDELVYKVAACPTCGTIAPLEGPTCCPACGESFI